VIVTNVRRLGVYLLLSFAIVSAGLSYWQVVDAQALASRPDNPQVVQARRTALRGTIFDAQGKVLASTAVVDGLARRTYADPAFSHVIGYASLRFGTTALERAWDDILSGRTDPNPLRDLVNDILARKPQPKDVTLTIDQRLQDFAAAQLGDNVGAIVALDPATGAILAMTSTPTFDATPISGDPGSAAGAMEKITSRSNNPLVDRARQGQYPPGSTMKVFTAAAALDAGVITTRTTFDDQPKQETDGFVVDGFRITEHDLSPVKPALWSLSEALQVSSNIFFAHVGLELGPDSFLDAARRFGFCEPRRIGSAGHFLSVDGSYVTRPQDDGCSDFTDRVELASAAFGQAQVVATPVQMALIASAIANDGVMPAPFVVRDARAHAVKPSSGPSGTILERYQGGGGSRVVSSDTAREVRTAMVDAVEAKLGRLYAGQADVSLYGAGDVRTAGKTGTAQRGKGQAPHSWFIGFAPGGSDATPRIAVAVLVEGGGSGAGLAAPIGGRVMAEWLRLEGE
jgi:penicillin-binding protein A